MVRGVAQELQSFNVSLVATQPQCVLPVHIMAVLDHLLQLLLSNPFHDNHSADPEDVREAKVDDAVCWLVITT